MRAFLVAALIATAAGLTAAPDKSLRFARKPLTDKSLRFARKPLTDKKLDQALTLRGGGPVSKELFIKTMSYANCMFGLQFLLIPKIFMEMNFDNFNTCDEVMFVCRICGIAVLSANAAFLLGDAEKLYPAAMATMALITWFGPITAERTFDCRMEHKLPLVLIPSILAMGAAAY